MAENEPVMINEESQEEYQGGTTQDAPPMDTYEVSQDQAAEDNPPERTRKEDEDLSQSAATSHEGEEPDGEERNGVSSQTSVSAGPPIQVQSPPAAETAPAFPDQLPRRERTESQSTAATSVEPQRQSVRSSLVFVTSALEFINSSKDASRRKDLKDLTQRALEAIKTKGDPQQIDPKILFAPLRLATEASTESVITTALDCIGKLISYSYFSVTPEQKAGATSESLIDQAIDTICDCFEGEATPDRVQLQITISLLAAVLNDKVVVHGAGLLKAVRQMYNIFLHSKNSTSQQVAQGSLIQMVGTVFERAKTRVTAKEARMNLSKLSLENSTGSSGDRLNGEYAVSKADTREVEDTEETGLSMDEPQDHPVEKEGGNKITLQTFERRGSFDEERLQEGPTMVTKVKKNKHAQPNLAQPDGASENQDINEDDEEDEVYMKDAFLVFRAMCKISIKSLRPDEIADMRSQGMRTKLLSLHIIHTILFNNIALFLSPVATIRSSNSRDEATPFTQAVKQLLCQSLSRNGASSVNRVFEVSSEIFWMMLKHLRIMLKKEIEVFLKEIYLTILDNRNAPFFQKQCFLHVLERLAAEPRALVEVYLNYDCDRTATENMFQRITENLSRMSSAPVSITSIQQHAYQNQSQKRQTLADWQLRGTVPPSLSAGAVSSASDHDPQYPVEYAMKQQSLDCLIEMLRSLVHWAQQGVTVINANGETESKFSSDEPRDSSDVKISGMAPGALSVAMDVSVPGTPLAEDDPMELEKAKATKIALLNAVRQFNFKPKRGIKTLIESGFIKSGSPEDIASFLMTNDRLNKAALGEYLGDGEQENVDVMHAFVDALDFNRTRFVDALRRFLQSFRLPGEAQKIDRFMLKFAERYISGNPNAFANADTAYVLAYSVIMLNTDQHSANVRKRMTPEDFIKNNRGINDNADLPDDYLRGIFDEIAHNEIVLDTERDNAANLGLGLQPSGGFASGIASSFSNAGRDFQREAFMQRSEEMANKTEQLFKSLLRAQRKSTGNDSVTKFIPATSFKHVGPMFDVTWMPFLTALSGCVQDTNNLETVKVCMDGLRLAIQIACLFDLQNPRQAFVSSIARFTNLYNLSEMKAKNVEALRVLLDVAYTEGNALKESWRDVLTCVSQLDRFQLISEGVPEKTVPDVLRTHHTSNSRPRGRSSSGRPSLAVPQRSRQSSSHSTQYRAEIAEESRSAGIVNGVDRIFSGSHRLSGEAIVDFVRALTQVSWQEIESSGQSQEPRTYSLQKLVEVSEYNMSRVRFEWTSIWQVLGDYFNQVGCHNNTKVVHFALNSLRQLSMRFLDLEELPGFKFQKDFLKPFEHIIGNTGIVQVKEIVLYSLIQMIQARGENIRSGWRTIFGVFTVAARERFEGVVNLAYENVNQIFNTRLGIVISQGAFADLLVCLTEFSKNARFQKKSLQAMEGLKSSIPKMLKTPECPLSSGTSSLIKQPTRQTQEEQFWFPVLFAFHDVLMTGEDLEVRSRALNYLFDSLIKYGKDFPQDFWDTIWRQLLYPIFMVLKSKSEMSKVVNHEELSVWLSTTMIQALRSMIQLLTHYFDALEYMLDRFLDLLALCICQENDTLARIGSNCLQTLILQNVNKFHPDHWAQIVNAFVDLFNRTEATALFSAAAASYGAAPSPMNGVAPPLPRKDSDRVNDLQLSDERSEKPLPPLTPKTPSKTPTDAEKPMMNGESADPQSPSQSEAATPGLEDYRPEAQLQQPSIVVTAARRRFFNQIITKCVLQLLMIETVNELFSNDNVYNRIPSQELLKLMALLKKSYHFAKRFNDDTDLRNRLFQEGFMKQPPNLLKQESGSASVYINILFRMYGDEGEERRASRDQIESALIPLCADIIASYARLQDDTQQRNIMTWRPVVVDVIEGYLAFPQEGFAKHAATFAPLAASLMGRDMGAELQRAVQWLVHRILELHYDMPQLEQQVPMTPSSPRVNVFGSRRASRAASLASGGRGGDGNGA
ncbi:MAG: guanine nucleotide exchange protein for ADP-robosylation factor [Chrysothrix sp. TS-e1954]|nr:MAG: guanine nucleotide exchange protein for ADP-robosylation factor [Chrysothrix sp. TS-e1954]